MNLQEMREAITSTQQAVVELRQAIDASNPPKPESGHKRQNYPRRPTKRLRGAVEAALELAEGPVCLGDLTKIALELDPGCGLEDPNIPMRPHFRATLYAIACEAAKLRRMWANNQKPLGAE